jgi:beta-lactamase class A
MKLRRRLVTVAVTVLSGLLLIPLLAPPVRAAMPVRAAVSVKAAVSVSCRSSAYHALAARLDRDIDRALHRRVSAVAIGVDDPRLGLQCWLNGSEHFDSASVIKVTILSALLRKAQEQHRQLTRTEAALAQEMITESDNDAASDLWVDVGRHDLQRFLNLAHMAQTHLGSGPYWGLTQITAYNEVLLLRLLVNRNAVLDTSSRDYVLGLMARVIPSQRWGVPAGAPTGLTVHVKNGWLPLYAEGWQINSIGAVTGRGGGYRIVVLTRDNPTMIYGIDTVQAVAEAVNRDLNPSARSRVPAEAPAGSWGTPDESIPAAAELSVP